MDTAAFLPCFSATAELLVINLVTHHDPKSDSEFSSCGDSRFSRSLLHQFAPMKTFQRRMALDCVHRRFAPQISQQCVPCLVIAPSRCRPPLECSAYTHANILCLVHKGAPFGRW